MTVVEDDLKDVLLPDEHVLWTGKPKRISRVALYYGLFALVLIGSVAAPMAYAALTRDMSVFGSIDFTVNGERVTPDDSISIVYSSLMMSAIVLLLFVGATALWAVASLCRSFVLTGERAIIESRFPVSKTSSILLSNVAVIERRGGAKIGTVTLFPSQPGLLSRIMNLYQIPANSFTNIDNPKAVEEMILSAAAQARQERIP